MGDVWLETTWLVDYVRLTPELGGNLSWRVTTDAGQILGHPYDVELVLRAQQPVCGHIEVRNVATGEMYVDDEECYGEDILEFGPIETDPNIGLNECASPPYIL